MDITERVLKIISEEIKTPVDKINLKEDIRDMGIDSLATVEIIIAIEEELGIDIPEDSVEDLQTVQDIVSLCNRLHS